MEAKAVMLKPKQQASIAKFDAETLIAKAIENGVPVETMERLLSMRRELKAEFAKEAYDVAMSKFQAECPTIEKRKKVSFENKFGSKTSYSYAPLEDIVDQVKTILSKNGFSYTFDTEQTDKGMKIYCKVKHKLGHMEISEFQIQIDTNAKMNVSQQYGSASTYAKRYAFCNAFGILTGDEDTDANTPQSASPQKPLTPRLMAEKKEAEQATNGNGDKYLISEKQVHYIHGLLKKKGYTDSDLLKKYDVSSMQELTKDQASSIIENLMKLQDKKQDEAESLELTDDDYETLMAMEK